MTEKNGIIRKATESLLIGTIKGYRRFISPLLPSSCIYNPTCSVYAETAIRKHGVIKGMRLAISRLIRCNPFRKGGDDPVPDKWEKRK